LLTQIIERNGIVIDDIASVFFTTSSDLTAEFPAVAARELGWNHVAMLCAHEMDVPHGLRYCIRVMIHWNTEKRPEEIHHVYLHGAVHLRPDWLEEGKAMRLWRDMDNVALEPAAESDDKEVRK